MRGDGPATLAAFLSAVTVTAAHDYSPEQVVAWSAPEERTVVERSRARTGLGTIVATEQHPILRGVRMTNYRMMKTLEVPVIEIRRAAIADAAGVAHVHVEAWRQAYASQLPADLLANLDEASRAAQWTQTISDGITDVYVAEADGKIVGWATGSGGRDEGAPARRELEGIYLLETACGSGAGQLLLDAVVADAPAYSGCSTIIHEPRPSIARILSRAMGQGGTNSWPAFPYTSSEWRAKSTRCNPRNNRNKRSKIPTPIHIRTAEPGDYAVIEAIENAADAMLIDPLQPEHWEPAPSGAVRNSQPGFLLVAFESARDSVIGFVLVLEIDGVAHLEQLVAHRGLG